MNSEGALGRQLFKSPVPAVLCPSRISNVAEYLQMAYSKNEGGGAHDRTYAGYDSTTHGPTGQ
jgi:hypothetical protein